MNTITKINKMIKKLLSFFILIFLSQISHADENEINLGTCTAWVNEFIKVNNDKDAEVDSRAASDCLDEMWINTSAFGFSAAFTSKEAAIAAYNLVSFSKANEISEKNEESQNLIMDSFEVVTKFINYIAYIVSIVLAITGVIVFYKNFKNQVDSGSTFSFKNFKPTFLILVAFLLCFPGTGLNAPLILFFLLILIVLSQYIELKLSLILIPSFFALVYSSSGADLNSNVVNNANFKVDRDIVISGLYQKQCEITNRNNIIFQFAKKDNFRSKVLADSAQEIMSCFNQKSEPSTIGNKAYGAGSQTFNQCFSNFTDNTYKVDCGYINVKSNDTGPAKLIAGYESEIEKIYDEIHKYKCTHFENSDKKDKNSQNNCISIENGIVQSDESGHVKYIDSSISLEAINKMKKDLSVRIRKDIEARDYKPRETKLKELAYNQLENFKYVSAAAVALSISEASRQSPTYSDYLKIFDNYQIVSEYKERDENYTENLDNSQTNSDSFFLSKYDPSINKIIDIKSFHESNQLDRLIQEGSIECLQNKSDCESVTTKDLSNIQNMIIRSLNTLNTINWTIKVVAVIDPARKNLWNQISFNFTMVSVLMYVFIFSTLFLFPWLYIAKVYMHYFKTSNTIFAFLFSLYDVSMTILFRKFRKTDDDSHNNEITTISKVVNIRQMLINLTFERYFYLLCWVVSFKTIWFMISELTKISTFESTANIEGTIFGSFTALLSLVFFIVIIFVGNLAMLVLPEVLTNQTFKKILKTNRDVALDNKVLNSGKGFYSQVKKWGKLLI